MIRKLLDKLNNKHFLSLAGNGFVAVFGLVTFSVLYKFLPIEDAGKWVFFLTILSLCEAVRNGFLGTATIKFYAGTERARGNEVLGSVWLLAMAMTAIVIILNAIGYNIALYSGYKENILTIKWIGVTFLSSLPFSVIYWKLQAEEEYGKLLRLKFVNSSSTLLVFCILAFTKKMSLENVFLYNFLTNCLTSAVGLVGNMGRIGTVVHRSRASIFELIHYGKYSLATTLSSNVLGNVDTFIITFMLGHRALAIYSIPMKLLQIVDIPLQSFVGTGMSGMAIAFNSKNMEKVTFILKKYAGMLTMAFIPLAILAFFLADLGTYIAVLGNQQYLGTEAANIFRWYMLFCLMYPIDRFNGATLDIIHKPKINFYKVLIMLAVNLIGDVAGVAIFKSLYGIVAAAFLTHFAGVVYGYYVLNRYLPVSVGGIVRTGYSESIDFIKKQLKLTPKL